MNGTFLRCRIGPRSPRSRAICLWICAALIGALVSIPARAAEMRKPPVKAIKPARKETKEEPEPLPPPRPKKVPAVKPTPQPGVGTVPMKGLAFETLTLNDAEPPIVLNLAYRKGVVGRHPVILMLGAMRPGEVPFWSTNLVSEGYMLATFIPKYPPDPDPRRRPEWLNFDQRFAHSYVLGASRTPGDSGRVIDLLSTRKDVLSPKIGWLGSSSTGIPGLAAACREPRIAAVVAFVSTGAIEDWLQTWHTNKLWKHKDKSLWPETEMLLEDDPINHVAGLYPAAVLMVNGSADKVVDAHSARLFFEAAKPYYANDPSRLRLVMYEGFTHNLPQDVVRLYAEHWFHLYLHPTQAAPKPAPIATNLPASVRNTQINETPHEAVTGAAPSPAGSPQPAPRVPPAENGTAPRGEAR